MTPNELSEKIAGVNVEVTTWVVDADWDRDDLSAAIEVWDRLDRLIGDLLILRREHAITVARRVDNETTVLTRDGQVTIHRDTPRNERWEGLRLLHELAVAMVDKESGEVVEAIPVDVLGEIIPACGPDQTSSKWKITALRKVIQNPEAFRSVEYGPSVIARGPLPSRVRNLRPPPVDEQAVLSPET